ncbi:hypothetical protein [Lysobacter gummosus]|uniref:hypothetical protein n=1 Tax=Lysobacter gummosus TaxID=262324 RepID=UPI00363815AF
MPHPNPATSSIGLLLHLLQSPPKTRSQPRTSRASIRQRSTTSAPKPPTSITAPSAKRVTCSISHWSRWNSTYLQHTNAVCLSERTKSWRQPSAGANWRPMRGSAWSDRS